MTQPAQPFISSSVCSTPEGIEAGRTSPGRYSHPGEVLCSTPEGIEAGRTRILSASAEANLGCSTPEGIEAGRTAGRVGRGSPRGVVLNARGHRGGKNRCEAPALPRIELVLNARGHRGGKNPTIVWKRIWAIRCSTPEGIEAGRTRRCRPGGQPRGGCAQRPRASRREEPVRQGPGARPPVGCSTPEGIEAGRTTPLKNSPELGPGAQRPRASRREERVDRNDVLRAELVLNARGHRGGKNAASCSSVRDDSGHVCSTPEGIEAGRPPAGRLRPVRAAECSTPEGIEAGRTSWSMPPCMYTACAQRPRASRREEHYGRRGDHRGLLGCSTPEGIEAGRTSPRRSGSRCSASAQRPRASRREEPCTRGPCTRQVFGAQRPRASRREERAGHQRPIVRSHVLNARGHRGGKNQQMRCGVEPILDGAQRPRASRREELPTALRIPNGVQVLNARGHRGGKNKQGWLGAWIQARCSTPEGIEAGRTSRPCWHLLRLLVVLNARGHRGGKNMAQCGGTTTAGKCSTPEGIEAGRTASRQSLVLNARGHRGGKNPAPEHPCIFHGLQACFQGPGGKGRPHSPNHIPRRATHGEHCVLSSSRSLDPAVARDLIRTPRTSALHTWS